GALAGEPVIPAPGPTFGDMRVRILPAAVHPSDREGQRVSSRFAAQKRSASSNGEAALELFPPWWIHGYPEAGRFHTLGVLSMLAVASSRPSGLNATPRSPAAWPVRVRRQSPVAGSQSFAVLSSLAVASSCPSGLNTTP